MAHAQNTTTLEVYETYHQAYRVADVIDSLLKPGETIKVFGNKLIVKASDETHQKILLVLEEIDRAPKNFLISLRTTDQYSAKKRYTSGEIHYLDDNTVIHLDNGKSSEDGVVVYKGSSRDGKIAMMVSSKENLTTRKEDLIQQVRALEGEQAFIATGDEIPVTQLVWANGSVLPHTQMDKAETGFYVRPIFSKGQVVLEISFQKQDRENKQKADKSTTKVSTHLRIPPDEWVPLAGLSTANNQSGSGTLYSTKRKGKVVQGIEIKVETIK